MPGRLYGVGLGPGDPELVTVKAARLIGACPVIAYFAKAGRRGHARGIADRYIPASAEELPLYYPMTTELPFDHPEYLATLARFYADATAALAAHLEEGRDVALLAEGDPLFYGSFMHLFVRLKSRFACEIVPGVTGMAGCSAAAGAPMTWGDDVLTVLPGTLPFEDLVARLRRCDAAVVMKLGRNFEKVRAAFVEAGLIGRAIYVERGTMEGEQVSPLVDKTDWPRALFLADPAARPGTPAVSGALYVIGLGPGPAHWLTPEASQALAAVTDLFGYGPYVARVAPRPGLAVHASDNRVELRARRRRAADGGEGPHCRNRLRRRSRRVRNGGGGLGGDRAGAAGMAHARRSPCCRASARCRRRRRGSARRSAAISARFRCPTI